MPNLGSQRDHSPSSEIASPPRTPPDRNSLDKAHVLHRQNGTATPSFSPLASPSMSLPSLGMSPFTPSGRPVSPPFMGSSPSSRSRTPQLNQDDLPLGSKITLIQRLTDLAMKINQENRDEDKSLNKLHAMMDQMESVLSDHSHHQDAEVGDSGPSKSSPRVPSDNAVREPQAPEDAMHDGSNPVTPVKPSPSSKESHESKGEDQTRSERATKISGVDAERIHIHDLLIMRAERAAQRIMYLEKRVQELENERNENEMEILNLQFQLKAIEVQCLSYVPKDADQDLRESISAWKTEWSALKRKRSRKKEYAGSATSGSPQSHARTIGSPGTPSRSSRPTPRTPGSAGG
ncbi:hypothetical protein MGN70_012437 [Eutypa lata]|nr:hypothetical protein MGN70_012437 [Eutypa lata]